MGVFIQLIKSYNWVKKDINTGRLSIVNVSTIYKLFDYGKCTQGYIIFENWLFARNAEIAIRRGWNDMAEYWRSNHICPNDCPMNLCSSNQCYWFIRNGK